MTPAFQMTPLLFVGALLIGGGVGVLTGLFGVGGGFLITPLLNALLGVPMPIAVGTGALQILGTTTAGLYRRRSDGLVDYKMAAVLFGGNAVGVRLGDAVVQWLKGLGSLTVGGETVAVVDLAIQITFVVLLGGITFWLWRDTARGGTADDAPEGLFARLRIPPTTTFASVAGVPLSIPVMSYFGLFLGFLTGLLGIGGGVVLVPGLLYLVGMRAHAAAATSLAIVWLSSLVAAVTKTAGGDASLALVVPLLLGGTAGLQAGVSICNRLSAARLKRYFSFVVLAAMLLVASKVVGLFI
ncbi:MAG: sulfite exporter TauE/SafE family protein [Chloroflexi bacterium]|jgi:uncharacterized membrane protein YfcA|nr:sulfite exporter TauE/SafE family protein [Chloroflexota bacterium]